jgi:hypothetical protein
MRLLDLSGDHKADMVNIVILDTKIAAGGVGKDKGHGLRALEFFRDIFNA